MTDIPNGEVSIREAPWFSDPGLQTLLKVLNEAGEEARIAGGAVRNALLGEEVLDVDIATTTLPDETIRRAQKAGFKAVATGYEHGTITVIVKGKPYEVTTLRADVETFGRHARVVFGRDWKADAQRRDFTINALYADADGRVIDLVGGLADLRSRTLRFIGNPQDRIKEDYLRILRFFRFFAWYGSGRPDAEGLKACARLKEGIAGLSAERVWMELKKLFSAPDPTRALLWMRQTSVLSTVLPESEKWGIEATAGLVAAEQDLNWRVEPLLRLAAIIPPDVERVTRLAQRLRFSRTETEALTAWSQAPSIAHQMRADAFKKLLYRSGSRGIEWRIKLALAAARIRAAEDPEALAEAAGYLRLLDIVTNWEKPVFPLRGKDLLAYGFESGKELGTALERLEEVWIDSGFQLGREELLNTLLKEE